MKFIQIIFISLYNMNFIHYHIIRGVVDILSARLKKLRKEHDITQVDLAQSLNLDKSSIAKYESANVTPSPEILLKLANKFNVTTDYLLGRVDDPAPPQNKKSPAEAEDYDITKEADRILAMLADSETGTLMLDGEPATPEAIELFKDNIAFGIEQARKANLRKRAD